LIYSQFDRNLYVEFCHVMLFSKQVAKIDQSDGRNAFAAFK